MWALAAIIAPLVALIVWGVVYDIRRRRRAPGSDHDVISAARKQQAEMAEKRSKYPQAPNSGTFNPGGGVNF